MRPPGCTWQKSFLIGTDVSVMVVAGSKTADSCVQCLSVFQISCVSWNGAVRPFNMKDSRFVVGEFQKKSVGKTTRSDGNRFLFESHHASGTTLVPGSSAGTRLFMAD